MVAENLHLLNLSLVYTLIIQNIKYDTYDIDAIPTDEMLKITTLITNDSYLVKGTIRSHNCK